MSSIKMKEHFHKDKKQSFKRKEFDKWDQTEAFSDRDYPEQDSVQESLGMNIFRQQHLHHILSTYDLSGQPMDLVMRDHFKSNKAVGSKDRAFIAKTGYALIRHLGLIDYLLGGSPTWPERVAYYFEGDLEEAKQDPDIPLHVRACMPLELFEMLEKQYGQEKALSLAESLNQEAPTTIRVNPLKTTREALIKSMQAHVDVKPTQYSSLGIVCSKRIDLFSLKEFKDGLFEVQDEASQLASLLVASKPGDAIMDYCAGSGGKSLIIAAGMQNKGQLYLHDIRKKALAEAKVRLKRAGVQNAQIVPEKDPRLQKLKQKMDWVLVDAPCSGSGTLRRNPDMKWKINADMIQKLKGDQRKIFETALSYVKKNGHIVYATCSLLEEENEKQVEHFLSKYPIEQVAEPFVSLPKSGEMDGFFAVVFKKK